MIGTMIATFNGATRLLTGWRSPDRVSVMKLFTLLKLRHGSGL